MQKYIYTLYLPIHKSSAHFDGLCKTPKMESCFKPTPVLENIPT